MKTEDNKQMQRESIHPLFLYTILFIGLASLIFSYFMISKQSFIWKGDGFSQHYLIYSDYISKLRALFMHQEFALWDWTIGLGSDTIHSYGYYVIGDPFVYLGLLFPSSFTELSYHVLILLRVYFVGISFLFFAQWLKFSNLTVVWTSLIYAFSHFALYNVIRHPFFILPMIIFPFVIYGFERMLTEGKTHSFSLAIFLSAFSNFYFFYKISWLLLIYAVIRFYNFPREEKTIKHFLSIFILSLRSYLIGVLAASLLFLPMVLAFLNSSRNPGGLGINLWLYPLNYYAALLEITLTPGAYFWFVGGFSVVGLAAMAYLWNNRQKYSIWLTNILFLLVMSLFPWFASLMNGFSGPYNRFSFVLPFYLTVGIGILLDSLADFTKKDLKLYRRLLSYFSLIHLVAMNIRGRYLYYIVPILLGWVLFFILKIHIEERSDLKKNSYSHLLILIVVNIILTSWNYYMPYGKNMTKSTIPYGTVEREYQNTLGGLEKKLPQTDQFYRVGTSSKDSQVKNQFISLNIKGLNSYLSVSNKYVNEFARSLSLKDYQLIQPLRNGLDDRWILNKFLNVRYIITEKENSAYLPKNYELIEENEAGTHILAETQNYYPFAYGSSIFISQESFEELHPIERENYLLLGNVISSSDSDSFSKAVLSQMDIEAKAKLENFFQLEKIYSVQNKKIEVNKTEDKINLSEWIDEEELLSKHLYISLEGIRYVPFDSSKILRNNTGYEVSISTDKIMKSASQLNKYRFSSYFEKEEMLFYLGIIENEEQSNDAIHLHFNKNGIYSIDELSIFTVEAHANIEKKIINRWANSLDHLVVKDDRVSGEIQSEGKELLITSIPYSNGWSATINGEQKPIHRINIGFVGIPLEEGKNTIQLTYRTSGLITGGLMSVIGFLLIFLEMKKKT